MDLHIVFSPFLFHKSSLYLGPHHWQGGLQSFIGEVAAGGRAFANLLFSTSDDAIKELSCDVIVNHILAMYVMTTAKRKLKIIL